MMMTTEEPAHDLPELARLPVPLIVNVMGFSAGEVQILVEAFSARPEVSALELNVSCPNVETGLIMGADPAELTRLLDAVRPAASKPLIVKLTPNVADPAATACVVTALPRPSWISRSMPSAAYSPFSLP